MTNLKTALINSNTECSVRSSRSGFLQFIVRPMQPSGLQRAWPERPDSLDRSFLEEGGNHSRC